MKIFAVIIAILITSGILKSNSQQVLSVQTSVEPTSTISPTDSPTPTSSIGPTAKPSSGANISVNSNVRIVNQGTGENGKVKISVQGADWLYPGSSDDSAAVVTDWFVNKIKSLGMSTRSFVKTNANDHVLNCLTAAGSSLEVKIEISQNSDSSCQW